MKHTLSHRLAQYLNEKQTKRHERKTTAPPTVAKYYERYKRVCGTHWNANASSWVLGEKIRYADRPAEAPPDPSTWIAAPATGICKALLLTVKNCPYPGHVVDIIAISPRCMTVWVLLNANLGDVFDRFPEFGVIPDTPGQQRLDFIKPPCIADMARQDLKP